MSSSQHWNIAHRQSLSKVFTENVYTVSLSHTCLEQLSGVTVIINNNIIQLRPLLLPACRH